MLRIMRRIPRRAPVRLGLATLTRKPDVLVFAHGRFREPRDDLVFSVSEAFDPVAHELEHLALHG
jgi:hypothetical protein